MRRLCSKGGYLGLELPRIVKSIVLDKVRETGVSRWMADGLSGRVLRLFRRLLARPLQGNYGLDLEKAQREFEVILE